MTPPQQFPQMSLVSGDGDNGIVSEPYGVVGPTC